MYEPNSDKRWAVVRKRDGQVMVRCRTRQQARTWRIRYNDGAAPNIAYTVRDYHPPKSVPEDPEPGARPTMGSEDPQPAAQ